MHPLIAQLLLLLSFRKSKRRKGIFVAPLDMVCVYRLLLLETIAFLGPALHCTSRIVPAKQLIQLEGLWTYATPKDDIHAVDSSAMWS